MSTATHSHPQHQSSRQSTRMPSTLAHEADGASMGLQIAKKTTGRYRAPVTVNPVTDLGRSISKRRNSAHHTIAGALVARRDVALWRLCVGHLRVCRVPFAPVGQPAYSRLHCSLGRER